MNKDYLEGLKSLDYANLNPEEEEKLREFEKKFNKEFDSSFYFMVMKR